MCPQLCPDEVLIKVPSSLMKNPDDHQPQSKQCLLLKVDDVWSEGIIYLRFYL